LVKINLLKLFGKMGLNVRMRESEKALLHVLEDISVNLSEALVMGAVGLVGRGTVFHTPYKGESDLAASKGGLPFDPSNNHKYAKIIVIGTKQKEETAGLVAMALERAAHDALVMVALENDWGGKGLDKLLASFGCPADHFSKHKSRVVWTSSSQFADPATIDKALKAAALHRRADGEWTEAGVFSFEKLDRGTALLIETLNKSRADIFTIAGHGADFGCGIGDLSKYILKNFDVVKKLTVIDHDSRAVSCARLNLEEFGTRTGALWADIASNDPLPRGLDFVVMNPPFHQGKQQRIDLGQAFISKAAESLRANSTLLIVANVHLPYEEKLKEDFKDIMVLQSKDGFKIIQAKRK